MHPGDKVIVITYADYEEAELDGFAPRIVHVDRSNRVTPDPMADLQARLDLVDR